MDREYFYKKARELEKRSETELKKRQDNVEYHLRKNPSVSYDKIPNMRDLYEKFKLVNTKTRLLTQITRDLRTHLININRNDIRRYIFMIITERFTNRYAYKWKPKGEYP